jgi:phage tail-like protein
MTKTSAPPAAAEPAADAALYPPLAFRFSVSLNNSRHPLDSSFQEVSGIGSQMETIAVVEGGENRFVHQLPKSMKAQRAVLKRGIAPAGSPLVVWCRSVLDGGLAERIKTSTVLVSLCDAKQKPVRSWALVDAWPAQWDVEAFGAMRNEVAIEKIELCYAFAVRANESGAT